MKRKECKKEDVLRLIKDVIMFSHEQFMGSIKDDSKDKILSEMNNYIELNIELTKSILSVVEKNIRNFRFSFNKIVVILSKLTVSKEDKFEFIYSFLDILETHSKELACSNIDLYTKRLKIVATTFLGAKDKEYAVTFSLAEATQSEETIKIDNSVSKKEEPLQDSEDMEFLDFDEEGLSSNEAPQEDGFLDFEDFEESSETEKKNIEMLNKATDKKISAESWINEYDIEQEEMDNINEALDDFYTMLELESELSDNYIDVALKTLDSFYKFFDQTIEFIDMSSVIKKLMDFVSDIYSVIDKEQKSILKTFLDNVVSDLNKWTSEVINEKGALDIHYLDASIYSSIAQLEMVFDNKNKEEKTDEVELF